MAYSSGTFSRLYDWTTDRDAGVKIRADRMDAEFDGIATALTTAVLKDGTQTTTAIVPFAYGISIVDNKAVTLGTNSDYTIQYDETTRDSLMVTSNVEGAVFSMVLAADQGDDAGDEWKIGIADGGVLTLGNDINSAHTYVAQLTLTPNSTVASSTTAVAGNLTVGGSLTLGSGAVLSEAELEMLDGITAGTVAASKAVVVDSNKDIGTFRNVTIDGTFSDGNYTFDTSGNVTGLGTISSGAITTSGVLDITNTTDSSDATGDTGALRTEGGASIAKKLYVGTDLDVNGTTNLDAVDIDGAVQIDSTITVGANDQGYDIIFYGDTASANITWDTSADDLIFNGAAGLIIPDGQLTLGSTAVSSTAAELNLLDGVSGLVQADFTKLAAIDATAAELDLLDGSAKSTSSITIADTDGFIVIDGTTTKQIPASDIKTYVESGDITGVTAGVGLSGGGTSGGVTLTLDLSELSDVTPANGDKLSTLDSDGSTEQLTTVASLATLFAGTGLTASSSVIGVDTSQAITALTGGDLTIYEDANNADVSLKMGTSATESLTIQVLNGGSNKTAEEVHFSTATASGTADHGKMVFDVDGTDIMTIDDGGVNVGTGSLETATIDYTDGDLAITIADGGGITAAAGITSTAASNTFGATSFNDANITNVGSIALDSIASDAGTGTAITMSAGLVGNTHTNTSVSGTVAPDMSQYTNFVWTLTGNLVLDDPGDEVAGQSGMFVFIQDGTGSRTLSHAANQYFSAGGTAITLSTAAAAIDVVPYFVQADGKIHLGAVQKAFADA